MRAQVTMFIILGMLLLIGAAIFFFVKGVIFDRQPELPEKDKIAVTAYIESCLSQAAEKSIRYFGLSGGEPSPWSVSIRGAPVYYGEYEGMNLIPNPDTASTYLAAEICHEFLDCANFDQFEGLEIITTDTPKCTVSMGAKTTTTKLSYPVSVSDGNSRSVMSRFEAEVPVGMKTALICASELVKTGLASDAYIDPRMLDYSCGLVRACHDNGLVKVFQYTSLEEPPSFVFRFAIEDEMLNGCTALQEEGCI
jgi:hypothetical protein